jgi:hypothetical protein
MIGKSTVSLGWLCAKAMFYVLVSMQAADIIVVAYQQF